MSSEQQAEEFLAAIIPGARQGWKGASSEEINQIEDVAGRPLPEFYRWFLETMGRDMGSAAYDLLDFSARRILAAYREGVVWPHPKYLMIAISLDQVMPLHYFYDLDRPARGDAFVTRMRTPGASESEAFETLCEMLAWNKTLKHQVESRPVRCEGIIRDDQSTVLESLTPTMERLGFIAPIPHGPFCGVFHRGDASLVTVVTPSDEPPPFHVFDMGGADHGSLRRILGAISTETSLEIKVKAWTPEPG